MARMLIGIKATCVVTLGLAALSLALGAQARDADSVLRDMRKALGGDAVLDAVKTFSVSGRIDTSNGSFDKSFALERFVLLPDHFLEVRRDSTPPPGPVPMDIDITYYRGFRGDVLIRRTDSNIPFPPDPGPQTPAAIADREQRMLQSNKRDFARLAVALFGKSFAGSPLVFSFAGPETVDGQATEVVDMQAPDGFAMRMYVNQSTHLPALIAWQGPAETVITTRSTSVATVRGDQVISETPTAFGPVVAPTAAPPNVMWRLVLSDFKVQDGLNWPHRLKVTTGTKVTEDVRLGKFKINPKIDARKFDIGR
jgi:hypothetical protein